MMIEDDNPMIVESFSDFEGMKCIACGSPSQMTVGNPPMPICEECRYACGRNLAVRNWPSPVRRAYKAFAERSAANLPVDYEDIRDALVSGYKWTCEKCGKIISAMSLAVFENNKTAHVCPAEHKKNVVCPICKRPFLWEIQLKNHLQTHN